MRQNTAFTRGSNVHSFFPNPAYFRCFSDLICNLTEKHLDNRMVYGEGQLREKWSSGTETRIRKQKKPNA